MNLPVPPDSDHPDPSTVIDQLVTALRGRSDRDASAADWLADARTRVRADPDALPALFAAVGRRCGRTDLPDLPGWTADEAARTLLLLDLSAATGAATGASSSAAAGAATSGQDDLVDRIADCYDHGDGAERRAVLKALPLLPVGDRAVPLLHDAIRTNDTRLLAAALGRYARHLDQPMWRQAVLKCVFTGVPLSVVHDLDARADDELRIMLAGLADERTAAGRALPADAVALLDRLRAAAHSSHHVLRQEG